jgi:tRNA 2-selenouridine synthase
MVNLQASLSDRVRLLCEDYAHFVGDVPLFATRLAALKPIVGTAVYDQWLAACQQGQWSVVVQDLLTRHYDPNYLKASDRLFPLARTAIDMPLKDLGEESLRQCAQTLMGKWQA